MEQLEGEWHILQLFLAPGAGRLLQPGSSTPSTQSLAGVLVAARKLRVLRMRVAEDAVHAANLSIPQVRCLDLNLTTARTAGSHSIECALSPQLRCLSLTLNATTAQMDAIFRAMAHCSALERLAVTIMKIPFQVGTPALLGLVRLLREPGDMPRLTHFALTIANAGITSREAQAIATALSERTDTLSDLKIDVRDNRLGMANAPFVSPWVALKRCADLRSLSIVMDDNCLRQQHIDGTLFVSGALPKLQHLDLAAARNGLTFALDCTPLRYADHLVTLALDITGIQLRAGCAWLAIPRRKDQPVASLASRGLPAPRCWRRWCCAPRAAVWTTMLGTPLPSLPGCQNCEPLSWTSPATA